MTTPPATQVVVAYIMQLLGVLQLPPRHLKLVRKLRLLLAATRVKTARREKANSKGMQREKRLASKSQFKTISFCCSPPQGEGGTRTRNLQKFPTPTPNPGGGEDPMFSDKLILMMVSRRQRCVFSGLLEAIA